MGHFLKFNLKQFLMKFLIFFVNDLFFPERFDGMLDSPSYTSAFFVRKRKIEQITIWKCVCYSYVCVVCVARLH